MALRPAVPALSLAIALALPAAAHAQDAPPPPPVAPAAEAAPAPESDPIPWEKDLAAAREKAAKEGKGLLVYLTPDWFT